MEQFVSRISFHKQSSVLSTPSFAIKRVFLESKTYFQESCSSKSRVISVGLNWGHTSKATPCQDVFEVKKIDTLFGLSSFFNWLFSLTSRLMNQISFDRLSCFKRNHTGTTIGSVLQFLVFAIYYIFAILIVIIEIWINLNSHGYLKYLSILIIFFL